ncbi:hypothetical protein EV189_0988 [Motilibacter rhizosphaerae]|uniref:Lipase (Class 3) n=1 Tax=Motilibacter rhizosphaerae TaxID=598652 RepID=A0A4Q7NWP8_9ACTN|nr:hypothetical protein [Motilibacter rhizosphaerae]RZS91741.1 hypothetical protein EV189_0988 [Motilibacter rhizosphaerae]
MTRWQLAGGAGGVTARHDDMLALARCYDACAEALLRLLAIVLRVAASPVLEASLALDPIAAHRVGGPLAGAGEHCGSAAAGAEGLAAELRLAVEAQVAADRAATALLQQVEDEVGRLAVAASPLLVAGAVLAHGDLDHLGAEHVRLAGLLAGGLGGAAGAALAGPPVPLAVPLPVSSAVPALPWSTAVRLAGLLVPDSPGDGAALPLPGPGPGPGGDAADGAGAAPPRTPGDLLRGVARRDADGSVGVVRVHGRDGVDRWVVELPGTASWSPRPGSDPRDLAGDLALVGGGTSAYAAAVVAALDQAGVPAGAPLLLAGHSLGGLAAVALASDPAVRARWSVRCVITAGSPLGRRSAPPGVEVLAVEDREDLVPALDGRANRDSPGLVTATFGRQTGSVVGNHDLAAYARAADALPTDAPVLARWRAAAAGFLDGERADTSRWRPVRRAA